MKPRLCAAVVVLAAIVAAVAFGPALGGGARAEEQPTPIPTPVAPPAFALDLSPDVTPCLLPIAADQTRTVAPRERFTVDACWFGDPHMAGQSVGLFQAEVGYDDAVIRAPEVADSGPALDDNPDFDQVVVSGKESGGGWDCSGFGLHFPTGDQQRAGAGPRTFIMCKTVEGPYALDAGGSGRLFSITFDVVGRSGDTTNLAIWEFSIANDLPAEIASCNPVVETAANCPTARVDVSGEAATATPLPAATPSVTPEGTPGGTPGPGNMDTVALAAGCNPLAATWPNGTNVATVAAAVSPADGLVAVWKFDAGAGRWLGYSPSAPPEVSDLKTVERLDAIFVCMTASGSVTRPKI